MEYEIKLPEGQKFKVAGPEGFTQEQAWAALQQQIQQAPGQDPELLGFDPHREEGGSAGGIYKRAGGAFLGSAKKEAGDIAGGIWNIISDPKAAGSALYEMGWEGVTKEIKNDLTRHYGSMDRVKKTFEQDPARFLMDALTVGTGAPALLRKLMTIPTKATRTVLPGVASKMSTGGATTPVAREAFELAGQAGEAGGQAAQQFRRGIHTPAAAQVPGQTLPAAQAAGEAIGAGGWAPRKLTMPALTTMALEGVSRGHLPHWLTTAAGVGGVAASSPRLAGETMFTAGMTERMGKALPRARGPIIAAAAEYMRDAATRGESPEDRKAVRAASKDSATSEQLLRAHQILSRRETSYGGVSGDTPEPRQEGGPVEAGQEYQVGEQGPEAFIPRGPPTARVTVAPGAPPGYGGVDGDRVADDMEAYQRAAPDLGPSASGRAVPTPSDAALVGMIASPYAKGIPGAMWQTLLAATRGRLAAPDLGPAPASPVREKLVPPIEGPAASRGLQAVPGTVAADQQVMPEPERHGGKTFPQFATTKLWSALLDKGAGVLDEMQELGKRSFAERGLEHEERTYDPGKAAFKGAGIAMTGGVPFAQRGALGMAGGRLKIPEPSTPLGTHAVEQKLDVNQILDPKAPAMFEPRSRNVRDIAQGLHERGSKALKEMGITEGKITAETRTPETDALLARTLASEAKEALARKGHAGDWYTKSVADAVKEASKIFPEIVKDTGARSAFTAAKAITSQGETVPSNVRLTNQVYSYFRKHGRFPTNIKADKQKYINNNFKKLNALIKELGSIEEVSKFLEKKFTVRELAKLAGVKVGALKFPADYEVYGSSLLGPKIGHGFYQNLIGNFNPVTTDLWLMRTWGRMTGTLHGRPQAVEKAQARLEAALTKAGEKIPKGIKALTKRAEEITDLHERDFKTNRALYDTGKKIKSELTKAAERLQANLSGIKETPSSGGERVWIAQVMDQARKLLEQQGIKLTNADLQAVLWYPEKDLYAKLGGRPSEGINVNYAQAWRDFAAKMKRPK